MARKSWYSWSPALPRGQQRGGGIQENNPLPLSDAQLGIWFAQAIDESSPAYNLAEYLEIGGPVDATLFERASQAEIEAEVRRCVDTAARHSGFILSTSCEIPPRSKPEIVQWFMDAAREYGRYDRFMS